MDPCEAALEYPLLYKEWSKKQTYIIAFWWTPLGLLGKDRMSSNNVLAKVSDSLPFSFVEDVTLNTHRISTPRYREGEI